MLITGGFHTRSQDRFAFSRKPFQMLFDQDIRDLTRRNHDALGIEQLPDFVLRNPQLEMERQNERLQLGTEGFTL